MSPCDVVNWPHSQALGRSLGMSPCDVVNWPHSQALERNLGMSPCDMLMMAMYPSAKWLTIADELRANFSSMFMFESASQALLFLHWCYF